MYCDKIKFGMNTTGSLNIPTKDFAIDLNNCRVHIGYNSGNLLINEYFKKNILFEEVLDINDADKVVLICANMLRPNVYKEWKFKLTPEFIKKMNKQLVVLGVGAQATFDEMKPKEYVKNLEPELIKYMRVLSDYSESIGVRGEFTADVLKELGIKNVSVVGCPTWFVNGFNQPNVIKKEFSKNLKPACYTCWESYSPWHRAWNNAIVTQALKSKKN